MPLVSSDAYPESLLDTAEALVAAELGTPSLEAHAVTQTGVLGGSGLLLLLDGPCTSIESVTLGGAPAAAVASGGWSVDLGALAVAGTPYILTYTAGWTAAALPPQVQQAVLLTVAALAGRPDPTIKSETMGPVSRSWDTTGGVPGAAGLLVSRWRTLRL